MAEMSSLSSSHYTVKVRSTNSNHTVSPKRLKVHVSKSSSVCKYKEPKKIVMLSVTYI